MFETHVFLSRTRRVRFSKKKKKIDRFDPVSKKKKQIQTPPRHKYYYLRVTRCPRDDTDAAPQVHILYGTFSYGSCARDSATPVQHTSTCYSSTYNNNTRRRASFDKCRERIAEKSAGGGSVRSRWCVDA